MVLSAADAAVRVAGPLNSSSQRALSAIERALDLLRSYADDSETLLTPDQLGAALADALEALPEGHEAARNALLRARDDLDDGLAADSVAGDLMLARQSLRADGVQ